MLLTCWSKDSRRSMTTSRVSRLFIISAFNAVMCWLCSVMSPIVLRQTSMDCVAVPAHYMKRPFVDADVTILHFLQIHIILWNYKMHTSAIGKLMISHARRVDHFWNLYACDYRYSIFCAQTCVEIWLAVLLCRINDIISFVFFVTSVKVVACIYIIMHMHACIIACI